MKEAMGFRQRWTYAHHLRPFTREQVALLPVTKEDADFLIEAGLPGLLEWVVPVPVEDPSPLAGHDGLYTLAQARNYLICVREGGGLIRLEPRSRFVQFLNSSVVQNARCNLLADQQLNDLESKARISVETLKAVFSRLWEDLIRIDPGIRPTEDCVWHPFLRDLESYWENEAEQFADERKTRN